MDDFLTSESIAISPDLKVTRLETINRTFDIENKIIVTHLNGYLRYLPTKEKYKNSILKLIKNKEYKREKLIDDLISIGYKTETIVTKTGEIGIRGFVIDIFPIESEHPVRIEYFGDEIDSIRIFDEGTQKTIEEIEEVKILPYTEFLIDEYDEEYKEKQKYLKKITNGKINSIYDYLENPITIFKNYNQLKTSFNTQLEQIFEYKIDKDTNFDSDYMYNLNEIKQDKVIYYNTVENIFDNVTSENITDYQIKEMGSFSENIEAINKFINEQIIFK